MRLGDLRPGDVLRSGHDETAAILFATCPHPLYTGLTLFVWRMSSGPDRGSWSHDALSAQTEIDPANVRVPVDEDARKASIRKALHWNQGAP